MNGWREDHSRVMSISVNANKTKAITDAFVNPLTTVILLSVRDIFVPEVVGQNICVFVIVYLLLNGDFDKNQLQALGVSGGSSNST